MSLADIFRVERIEWTVPGPPDRVYAWFVHEGAGGRQQWSKRRLRLAGDRWAGAGPGPGRGVALRPGPWLEVVATPIAAGESTAGSTLVTCTIGPQATCWGWAALFGAVLAFAAIVWTVVLATGVEQLRSPAVALAAVGPLGMGIFELRHRSTTGRELRVWAEQVQQRSIDALLGHPASTAPTATAPKPTDRAGPFPVGLALADRDAWHRAPPGRNVGHGLAPRRRTYVLPQPVPVTRRLLLSARPGWVTERNGQLFLDPGIVERGTRQRPASVGAGRNSCALRVEPHAAGSRIEVITSPVTGLANLLVGAVVIAWVTGIGGFSAGIGPPETPWIFGGFLVAVGLTQLVGTWKQAERLHHIARETMEAIGARPVEEVDPGAGTSAGAPSGSGRRPSPYTAGPDTWRDGS